MSAVKELHAGLTHSESVVVEKQLTVPEISPLFPAFSVMPHIFATPHLISLVESTCIIALRPYLTPEQRTVGVSFNFTHLAPTPMGMTATATINLVEISGKMLTFSFTCRDEQDVIGEGTHERAIIEVEKFMARVAKKQK